MLTSIARVVGIFTISVVGILSIVGSGGGGGSSSGSDGTPAPIADQKLGGIWFGTGTNNLEPDIVKTALVISTDAGEFRFISSEGVQSVGNLSVIGQELTGTSVDYAPQGFVFLNGMPTTTGTYSGTIVERESIEGAWQGSTGEFGDFVLTYDDRHKIQSSLATVSGTYTGFDEFNVPISSFVVDAAGNINGSDSFGCIYSGRIQIIDPAYNVYRINVNAENCGQLNGSYSGLGGYDPSDSSFTYQIDNSINVISNEVYK